ncbi:WD40 repeat-like protein [Atractiella rhizophila]|nr:WD40 repeat-like protein [Atractiella rhizophila]
MSFYCALSGEPAQNPVIVPQSGYVYEKSLLEKYFAEHGEKDPITDAAVEGGIGGVVVVKRAPSNLKISAPNTAPRPPSLTSIPSLLHTLQSEWDGVMLECAELRKVANQLRQDLSLALYKEDAAMRVLARVVRERDEARDALNNITSTLGVSGQTNGSAAGGGGDVEMEDASTEAGPLGAEAEGRIEAAHQSLIKTRKALKPPSSKFTDAVKLKPVTAEEVKTFEQVQVVGSLHGSKKDEVGISAVATWGAGGLNGAEEGKEDGGILATGGSDKVVQVYDRVNDKVLATLKGHTKPITSIVLSPMSRTSGELSIPTFLASSSSDKTVRLWTPTESASAKSLYKSWTTLSGVHDGSVTGLSLHPSNTLLASAASDGTWAIHDLAGDGVKTLFTHSSSSGSEIPSGVGFTSTAFHPDGALIGVGGSDGALRIWDPRRRMMSAIFESKDGAVKTVGFSENGFLLAVGYESEVVKVWDLRKSEMSPHTATVSYTAHVDPTVTSNQPPPAVIDWLMGRR